MADVLNKEQRRKNMKAIKSISKLESTVSAELWNRGYHFRRNKSNLKGKPDISIKKYKVVVFVDSCFFHQCPLHGNIPNTNKEFWEKKLNRNVERDEEVNKYYKERGWKLMRIWEHEVKGDLDRVINKIANLIESAK